MTVRVRKYKRGGWEVDIQFRWPEDMTEFRRRLRAPVNGKAAAQRWGEAREAAFLRAGKTPLKAPEKKEVPTLAEFQERFIQGYCKANRQKPSGMAGNQTGTAGRSAVDTGPTQLARVDPHRPEVVLHVRLVGGAVA